MLAVVYLYFLCAGADKADLRMAVMAWDNGCGCGGHGLCTTDAGNT